MQSRPWLVGIAVLGLVAGSGVSPSAAAAGQAVKANKPRGSGHKPRRAEPAREGRERRDPNDWFLNQRLSAGADIPVNALGNALDAARAAGLPDAPGNWVSVGPYNVGGRLTAVGLAPTNTNRIWVGTAAGGVFRTDDNAATWTPVFDAQTALSIGSIATHPTDNNILYVGGGEDNGAGYSYDGGGVYKTTDAGATWTNLGLAEVRRIGKLAVDPSNPQRVYAAAGGGWYTKDVNRGIYRSQDGGATWTKVLYVADDSGGIDIAIDPATPSRVYAAIWQRHSSGDSWYIGGANSGIWRSLDSGTTWTRLTSGLPTDAAVGRIGLAIAPSAPNVVYACVITASGSLYGIYKSLDSGNTWIKQSTATTGVAFSSYSYYFSQIRVDPANSATLYALDVNFLKSTNSGRSFTPIGNMHSDTHDLIVKSGGRMLAGNDGGFYQSTNNGAAFTHAENLPVTQLYDIGIDTLQPLRRFAGAQDNNVQRTTDGGLSNWQAVIGGDGLQVEVDPTNSNLVYGESQFGNIEKSTDGGANFFAATTGIDAADRTNWNAPITIDPVVPSTLYTGTYRVYKSTDGASNWAPVSGDLSLGPHVAGLAKLGPAWHDRENHLENLISGTVTVVAVSPVDHNVVWSGTDDGQLWVSTNASNSWTKVIPPGLAYWVTDVAPDPFDRQTAYLTVTGYRSADKLPYLRVMHDLGQTWQDIGAGLPQVPLNSVVADPQYRGRLFVGSDIGVLLSDDGGATWAMLHTGMPYAIVMDLVVHQATRTLYAATHARSIYSFDMTTLGPPDRDNDGILNVDDCAPDDPGAIAKPLEVNPLTATRGAAGATNLSWASLAAQAGTGTRYDVLQGNPADLPGAGNTSGSTALACGLTSTSVTDPAVPAAGSGVYYMVRGRNTCAIGSLGKSTAGVERPTTACP